MALLQKLIKNLIIFTIIISIICLNIVSSKAALPFWYNNSWQYRVPITINHSQVGAGGVINHTVLITEANLPSVFFSNCKSDGTDLVITSSDGITKLNRELVSINTSTKKMQLWVNVGNLSNSIDTTVYLYYGYAGANETANQAGTWDSNFLAIYHLADNAATTTVIESQSGYNATSQRNTSTMGQGTGPWGDTTALAFNGSSDYATYANSSGQIDTSSGPETIEGWAYSTSLPTVGTGSGNYWPVASYANAGGTNESSNLWVGNPSGTVEEAIWKFNGGEVVPTGSPTAISSSTWYHIGFTSSANGSGTAIFYQNGVQNGTSVTITSSQFFANTKFNVGSDGGFNFLPGRIQEVRVSKIVRSAAYFATVYNNISSPSSFYSVGGIQSLLLSVQKISHTANGSGGSIKTTLRDLGAALQTIKVSGGTVYSIFVNNTQSATPAYVQAFDANVIGGWYNGAWKYRVPVTINHLQVGSGGVTTHAVLITEANLPASFFSNVLSTGADIVATASDGITKLNRELVSINTGSSKMALWINVGTLSSAADSTIYLYYGNSSGSEVANQAGTWDSNFLAIYHMADNAANTNLTESANGLTATLSRNSSAMGQQSGPYGDTTALTWSAGDYGNATNSGGFNLGTGPGTIEEWIYGTSFANFPNFTAFGTAGTGYAWNTFVNTSKQYGLAFTATYTDTNALSLSTWYYMASVVSGTTSLVIYKNSSSDFVNGSITTVTNNVKNFYINSYQDEPSKGDFEGGEQELRISKIARSQAYLTTVYNNTSSPSTFYSVGSVQQNGVTLGVTNPDIEIYCPALTQCSIPIPATTGVNFSSGIVMGSTTGERGAVGSSSGVEVWVFWK